MSDPAVVARVSEAFASRAEPVDGQAGGIVGDDRSEREERPRNLLRELTKYTL